MIRIAAILLIIIGLLLMASGGGDSDPVSVSCVETDAGDTLTTECDVS